MEQNIIERNFVVSFLLGLGVIMTMAFVGARLAIVLLGSGESLDCGGFVR